MLLMTFNCKRTINTSYARLSLCRQYEESKNSDLHCCKRGAISVMVIVAGNGIGGPSSNSKQGCLCFTVWKSINQSLLPPIIGR